MANKLLCLLLLAGSNTLIWLGEVGNCNTTDLGDILFPVVEAVEMGLNQTVLSVDNEEEIPSNFSYKEKYKLMSFAAAKGVALNLIPGECLETAQRMNLLEKFDNECGDVLFGTEKTFWSPSPPKDCKWVVCNPRMYFRIVAIGMSEECDKYYFDVCDGCQFSQNGSLEKGTRHKFCGAEMYSEFVSTNPAIIVEYKMDPLFKYEPLAVYQLLKHKPDCVRTSSAENGIIESPEYPDTYPKWMLCKWKIIAPMTHRIIVTTVDFRMPVRMFSCPNANLEIWDGLYEEYPMISRFDRDNPPPSQFISNSNSVMISSNIEDCRRSWSFIGFKLTWKFQPTACNDTLSVSSGVITSPSYDRQNNQGLHCIWRIVVNPGNIIRLVILEFDAVTVGDTCRKNYVQVTDIDGNDTTIVRYCSTRSPPGAIYTTGNEAVVTLVMSSMGHKSSSFQLRFNAVCTRSLSGYSGIIESINHPNLLPPHLDCMWTITAQNSGSVFINLTDVDLGFEFGSLQIFEPERDATWGELGCMIKDTGVNTPATCWSRGKIVLIELKTSPPMYDLGTGFRLEWKIHGCGESIRNTRGMIQSTRYPNRYPVDEVCEWTIVTESGTGVVLTIHAWEIENSTNCKFDGLKVFTQPPHASQPILHLCGASQDPSVLTSELNKIYIQFYSDESLSFKGFNASFQQIMTINKTRNCGEDHFGPTGFIYSPNFPKPYNNLDNCHWTITVHHNYLAALKILEMKIGYLIGCERDNLTVFYDKVITGQPNEVFCGKRVPKTVVSSHNVMTVAFQTNEYVVKKGFIAQFFQGCGATLNSDRGIIQSPDFLSMMNGAGNCSWTIVASAFESRVVLLFTDFYWSVTDPICGQHYIEVLDEANGNGSLYRGCCSHVPPVVLSSGNVLTLRTTNAEDVTFKAFYFTVTEDCLSLLNKSSYSTLAAIVPNVTTKESKLACQQTLYPTSDYNQTVKVQFQLYQQKIHGEICRTHFVAVHVKDFSEWPTYNVCQQAIPLNEHLSTYFWSVYIILDGMGDSDDVMNMGKNDDLNVIGLSVENDSPISDMSEQRVKLISLCLLLLCLALY